MGNPKGVENSEVLVYRMWDKRQNCYINGLWEEVPIPGYNATIDYPEDCESHAFSIIQTPIVYNHKGNPILKYIKIK